MATENRRTAVLLVGAVLLCASQAPLMGFDDCNGNQIDDALDVLPGDPTFAAPVYYTTPNQSLRMVIGDIDGQNGPDVAVGSTAESLVSVFLNNGDGTLSGPTSYDVNSDCWDVIFADLNNDLHPDMVATNTGEYPSYVGEVSVFLNNGDGTFGTPVHYATLINSRSVAAGHLNADAYLDLVVGNGDTETQAGGISILLNNGDGSFAPAVNYEGGALAVVVEDFDRDGNADVASSNGGCCVSVRLGNGDGTLQPQVGYSGSGAGVGTLKAADVDGVNGVDLFMPSQFADHVSVILNNGDGTFGAPLTYDLEVANTQYMTYTDVDGDGDPDFAVCDGYGGTSSLSIMRNDGSAGFYDQFHTPLPGTPRADAAGDLDGDGDPDVVVSVHGDPYRLAVLMNETMPPYSHDCNGNGVPDECECPGDINHDCTRNLSDLAQLLANYGTTTGAIYEDGDMDGDGDVELSDLAALLAVYGQPCP